MQLSIQSSFTQPALRTDKHLAFYLTLKEFLTKCWTKKVKTVIPLVHTSFLIQGSWWEYPMRNVRNLRGSLQTGDLFAYQAVDDLICPPLPLWLYQTKQGKVFFLLKQQKKVSWVNERYFSKGGPSSSPSSFLGAAGEWNDSSCINYVWPQTEGSEWTCVDRRPMTLRRRWWKTGRIMPCLKGSEVRGYHLQPKCGHCAVLSLGKLRGSCLHTRGIPTRGRRGAALGVPGFTLTGNLDQPAISALNGSSTRTHRDWADTLMNLCVD